MQTPFRQAPPLVPGSVQSRQSGFTLMEVLLVVVIIGILASVAVLNLGGVDDDARLAKARQDITTLTTALDIYKLHNTYYPSTDQGLQALVQQPAGQPEARNWKQGGYLSGGLPKDPWGREYIYLSPGVRGSVDIYTLGKDGLEGGEGADADIGNWNG